MLIDEALEILGLERPRRPRNKIECPYHEERTPSLHLYEDDFYCYSCGANGDAFGLIAAVEGRDVGDVLKEYGDGNYETSRKKAANRAQQVKDLWNEWYEFLDAYVSKLYRVLDDLPGKLRTSRVNDIFHHVDGLKAELPHNADLKPHELEAHLREATAHLNDRLETEIALRNKFRVHAGVSPVAKDELPQTELRSALPEAGRPGGSDLRRGSSPRQYGSVRVEATQRLDEGDVG